MEGVGGEAMLGTAVSEAAAGFTVAADRTKTLKIEAVSDFKVLFALGALPFLFDAVCAAKAPTNCALARSDAGGTIVIVADFTVRSGAVPLPTRYTHRRRRR
jgi:hypothetical protein